MITRLGAVTLLILVVGLFSPAATPGAATRDGYAWVDYYHLGGSRYWMEIQADGEVLYLRLRMPGMSAIDDVRRGTLTAKEAADVFGLLGPIGFFTMRSVDPFAQGVVYEGDILVVSACAGGRCNTVGARPPGFIPPGLADFVHALEDKIPAMRPQPGELRFLRAEQIGPQREARIRAAQRPFVSVTDEQLKSRPALLAAIQTPGRFVPIDSQQLEQLSDVLPDRRSAFVSTPAPFQVRVFSSQN